MPEQDNKQPDSLEKIMQLRTNLILRSLGKPVTEREKLLDEIESVAQDNSLRELEYAEKKKQKRIKAELERLEETNQKEVLEREEIRKDLEQREKFLTKLRVTLPDLSKTIASKMAANPLEGLRFATENEAFLNLPGILDKKNDQPDFFSLKNAEREDLYDRVGIYRGMVIDHSQKEIVRQGFYNVLKRSPKSSKKLNELRDKTDENIDPETVKKSTPDGERSKDAGQCIDLDPKTENEPTAHTSTARILYRKPQYTGVLDSTYTFSEVSHQMQINGIRNLNISAAVTTLTGSGAGVGYGYHNQFEKTDASIQRTAYMISNYYLPKIELSFDYLDSCASDEFVTRIQNALKLDNGGDKSYHELVKLLKVFGHFIPASVTLGGKLFSTKTQELKGNQKASDECSRHASEVKAAINNLSFSAEVGVKGEHSNQEQMKDKNSSERQAIMFTAVGGEGSSLRDSGRWAESLNSYKGWTVVLSDNLIPTIRLLPNELRKKCMETLKNYTSKKTVQELLRENAHFLFYGDYDEEIGKHVKMDYYYVRTLAVGLNVLTLDYDEPADGALLKVKRNSRSHKQVWYFSPFGEIICLMKHSNKEFALTVQEVTEKDKAIPHKLVLMEKNRLLNQQWTLTGSGHLINNHLPGGYVLAVQNNQVVLEKKLDSPTDSQLWELIDIEKDFAASIEYMTKADAIDSFPKGYFTIQSDDGYFLSVCDGKEKGVMKETPVVAVCGRRGDEQLWAFRDGQLISKLKGYDNNEMVVTYRDHGRLVMEVPRKRYPSQQWGFDKDRYSLFSTKNYKVLTLQKQYKTAWKAVEMLEKFGEDYDMKLQKWSVNAKGESKDLTPASIPPVNYLFWCDTGKQRWFSVELLSDGRKGHGEESGIWDNSYSNLRSYKIDGQWYLLGFDDKSWSISRWYSNGTVGGKTGHGEWINFSVTAALPYHTKKNSYLFAFNKNTKQWKIFSLHSNGTMGNSTANGYWENPYDSFCVYEQDGKTFLFGFNNEAKNWFIHELTDDGTLGKETGRGSFNRVYHSFVIYKVGGHSHLFCFDKDTQYWYISKLQGGNIEKYREDRKVMGDGFWNNPYNFFAVYETVCEKVSKTYLCGFNDKRWFIQELLPEFKFANNESYSDAWDGRNKGFAILGVNQ